MSSTVSISPPASAWRARAALVFAAAVVLVTVAASVAQADGPNTGSSQGSTSGNFNVNAPGSSSSGGGGGSSRSAAYDPNARVCFYTTVYNKVPYRIAQPPAGQTAADGQSMSQVCGRAEDIARVRGSSDPMATCGACGATFGLWVKNATPSPAQIAQAAFANLGLQKPDIHTNPDTTDAAQHLVVGLPTWLWIDGKKDGYSVVKDGITIVAHQKVAWFADGTQISASDCGDSAGVAYVAGTSDPRAKPPCGYTFKGAGAHSLKAVVTWTGSFTGAGGAGPIAGPAIVFTSVKAVGVDEWQTVNR